jgi:predicted transcriptional regulator with HTH domain
MVLEYLVSIHPKKSYPSEIARKINLRSTDVCGALNGVSHRFKKENSLVNLNLVEKSEEKDVFLYSTTKLGCKIWKLLNE